MVEALEALNVDNPKVMGFDLYSCVGLVLWMGVVYMICNSDRVRKMTFYFVFALIALMYYKHHVDKPILETK